jgi:hypothetical protein
MEHTGSVKDLDPSGDLPLLSVSLIVGRVAQENIQ